MGVWSFPWAGVERCGWGECIHRGVPPGRRGLFAWEKLRRCTTVWIRRLRRVFGPVVRICILHRGVRICDIIAVTWRCSSGRRRDRSGLGVHHTGRKIIRGCRSLKGFVRIAHWRLCLVWLASVFGTELLAVRRHAMIVLRAVSHRRIVVRLPLVIHCAAIERRFRPPSTGGSGGVVAVACRRRQRTGTAIGRDSGGGHSSSSAARWSRQATRYVLIPGEQFERLQ